MFALRILAVAFTFFADVAEAVLTPFKKAKSAFEQVQLARAETVKKQRLMKRKMKMAKAPQAKGPRVVGNVETGAKKDVAA